MSKRIIITGGGTGGHIFPAIAIAGALRQLLPGVDILFVGARGRMEMDKVPEAGYPIEGLPVAGLRRRPLLSLHNLSVPFKLLRSLWQARRIVARFKPHAVVGVGGYASAPTLWAAQRRGIPTLIQEQNSYAGVTNRLLARRAHRVCVAYEGMERFFPAGNILLTGNPVRQELQHVHRLRAEAVEHFRLDPARKTLLVVGGSLGARTINQSVVAHLAQLGSRAGLQVLWQVGKEFLAVAEAKIAEIGVGNVKVCTFIARMDYAYAVADLVVSRAGACTVSELCVVRKPCILVPSPNVAEDHQTANASALERKGAALLIRDSCAADTLMATALQLLDDGQQLGQLAANIGKLALPAAAEAIAREVVRLLKE